MNVHPSGKKPHLERRSGNISGADLDKDLAQARKQVRKNPKDAAAWSRLGAILSRLRDFPEAEACTKRALELHPDSPEYLTCHGRALAELGHGEEALQVLRKAAAVAPDSFAVQANFALVLRMLGRPQEALAYFEAAEKIQPDLELMWQRGCAYLQLGRLKEGWKDYEFRPSSRNPPHGIPRWNGEFLMGATILVTEEQGFGDTILCARYLPLVKARGGRVILRCKPDLHRLFQSLPGADRVVSSASERLDEPFHCHVPLMSLPAIFGTDLSSIPSVPRLAVPAFPPGDAQPLLDSAKNRFRVGIVWSGNTNFGGNALRAVSAERFLPLAAVPGVQLYSLQKGAPEGELAACGGKGQVLALGPCLNDFADTAAVLRNLDLVIMTDSAVAHLAGSIGCPVWNLLAFCPYWLYMLEREDSPWYPSMRLFRQPAPGDWDGVFGRAAAELAKAVALKESGRWNWPLPA